MKVREIMTKDVVSCRREFDVGTAGRLMLQGRFGSVPVLDRHDKVAGVLTDRDIAMAGATRQRNASHIGIHEAMTEKVKSCARSIGTTESRRQTSSRRSSVSVRRWRLKTVRTDPTSSSAAEIEASLP